MIEIKSLFGGWKKVDKETALKYSRHIYSNATAIKDKVSYINSERLKGIKFTEEE